jgi:hypothetical protein
LRRCHDELGFRYVRFHGLLSDDIGTLIRHGSKLFHSFPLPVESYRAWTRTYQWKKLYGHEFLYAGPLFIHQLSHMWIDFRGIQDEYMSGKAIDYFENSRRSDRDDDRKLPIRLPVALNAAMSIHH